jgi:hypothetical protein
MWESQLFSEYHSPRVSFHIDKMNNYFFQKMNLFKNFEIIDFCIIYYKYCDMSSEIIHNVAYDNYDDFQQNFISLF